MSEEKKPDDDRFIVPYEGGYMVLQLAHLWKKNHNTTVRGL